MRLHLLKIFFLRVQLSNTCIILVFNMYVKIFHCKSQTEHNLQPFLKCMLKARSKWNWLKTAPLYFKKPAFVFLINTFYKRFSLQGLKMLLKDFWRDRQISSISRKISHSKCARYEFAILNLTRTKSGLFRFHDSIPRVGYLQFKPIPTIKSVHHVIVNQTSTIYHAWIVL